MRMATGNVQNTIIATMIVYDGIILGLSYNKEVLLDKNFRKFVKLSAMHQISLCDKGDTNRLFKATECISLLTGLDRDKLIVVETPSSIRVRVNYKSKLVQPIYYIFGLNKQGRYTLSQISYDINEAAKTLNERRKSNVN
jgi:hypothetical protein